MNDPDQISENLSPREELEVRILALLLGEANEAEKEELESSCQRFPTSSLP